MDNQLTPYSAYFKLYDGRRDNLQVAFNVTCREDDDVGQFIAKYQELVTMLFDLGLSADPAGLEEGEKIQEVDGWVLGETAATSQPCVHLYKSPLEWKVATVYQEKIDLLPIPVDADAKRWDGAAPTREMAEKKQVIHPCQFKIVLSDTGKTSDKGNKIYRFDRVYGAVKPSENGVNGPMPAQDEPEPQIDSYPDVFLVLRGNALFFANKSRETQAQHAESVTDKEHLEELITVLDETLADPGAGEIVLSILSGVEPIDLGDHLSGYLVDKLLATVPTHIEQKGKGGKMQVVDNPEYSEKVAKALLEVWLTAKKYTMMEDA